MQENTSNIDCDIVRYIDMSSDDEYKDVLNSDSRWEVFYHLSTLRQSLYNWYPFAKDSSLLEIGAGFGALTGLFCEKCGHVVSIERNTIRAKALRNRYKGVTNLDVYEVDFSAYESIDKFDYIVLTGILETQFAGDNKPTKYVEFLHKIKRLLKPSGRLLVAVNNKYGLKYFCGVRSPHTGKSFSGLNQYNEKSTGYNWGRKEFIDILKSAGFSSYKFFYPLPDYRIPQLIYSDAHLPSSNIHERIMTYYERQEPLLADEKKLYKDVAENNVFPFLANSFLVECLAESAIFSDVNYAAVTTDRGKENGFATIVTDKNTVRKEALFKEGQKNLEQLFFNVNDIGQHGVEIVPHSYQDGYVEMPYVDCVPLSEVLEGIVEQQPDDFVKIFEQLYESILKSSEHIATNELAKKYEGCPIAEGLTSEDYGPILEKCYIDMVPFNCFYKDGKLLFFDQEFLREGYPAKYTLFRALLYTYYFVPRAEKVYSLERMKEKYNLKNVWNLFNDEEQNFVSSNRNHELYKNLYKWSEVNQDLIQQRRNMLSQM